MADKTSIARLAVFPETATVDGKGHLVIGGCDTVELAQKFGTPLYVFDETDLRGRCREFKKEFGSRYPDTIVAYSLKAFLTKAMVRLIDEEGLDLDVVSGGELGFARAVGFPASRIHFPGNNKSREELELAIKEGIGHIVVDNLTELEMLIGLAGRKKVNVLLRLNPGIDPHTHKYNTTGIADSKFGIPRSSWDEAVKTALAAKSLNVDGLHVHIGSGLFEYEPYLETLEVVLPYAAELKKKFGYTMQMLSIGGGFGARYVVDKVPPTIATFAEKITSRFMSLCDKFGLGRPKLMIEPGRRIVAVAGVALYTVGVVKEIPGIRTYVSVDGGMGDNIRQPMYGAVQEALVANRAAEPDVKTVTICGKYCESGDILIREIKLPEMKYGDILAVAGSGAYAVPMSSNYNAAFRPAIVFVRDGHARLVRRRETLEDLMRRDPD
ncbi:MAG: diaminopimelate decarboxylase [Dehalococcoidales bacterium]|nr:diaminopimelate decarboxylase [Dehalococcoidales bacterium]